MSEHQWDQMYRETKKTNTPKRRCDAIERTTAEREMSQLVVAVIE